MVDGKIGVSRMTSDMANAYLENLAELPGLHDQSVLLAHMRKV